MTFVRLFLYEVSKYIIMYTHLRASYTFVKFNDVLKNSQATAVNSRKQTYLLARKFTRKPPVLVMFLSSEPRCFAVARKLQHRLTLYDIST